jgi:uncharacterized protein (DUF488 family)
MKSRGGNFEMPSLYTIGHSSHSLEEFQDMLKSYEITDLVDVRTIPKSRHVPWFNKKELERVLSKIKITYQHFPELGGLRRAQKGSVNQGFRNASFRGFADYMQTKEFYSALKKLNSLSMRRKKLVIMCAEAVPWRCHRSLIADAEIVRKIKVFHIMSRTSIYPHELTSFAVIDRNKKPIKIYYPV